MFIKFLTEIGLNQYDIALIFLCPIGAVMGSVAHAIVSTIDPDKPPTRDGEYVLASKELQYFRSGWFVLRVILGGILGIVVALYFIGSIKENISTVCKITALSVFIGYAAPKIWIIQERILINRLESLINKKLTEHNIL